jgi:hypothetical protein
LFAFSLCFSGAGENTGTPAGWPSFRGWFANGIAEGYRTPVEWNVKSGQKVLPQPIVAGQLVFPSI